ncbi:hypothetical protein N7476_005106 [Penicillium atrosanguineum]|uniref:Uncharacterized protein n=1 Tax=Penicillium atrosanguineum TaxID=1132637 RepID=A0A9W9U689_9EURO|nr:hypothetical protein N7476_005106 [Penicillium atrosanguineum]
MVQSLTVPVPEEVWLGIDIGTVTAKVAVLEVTDPANPAEFVDYPLKFPTNNRNQTTTELDTTLVFSKDGLTCTHGSGGLSYPEAHFFRDWKPGAMGLPPFAQILTNACRLLQKSAPQIKDFTPGTLFRTLLSHIAKTARDHIQNIYGHDIEVIRCILTYPVSCSEALQILLLQEASAAGLDVMGALSESMATAYSLQSHPRLTLLKGAKMFLDYGGATLV